MTLVPAYWYVSSNLGDNLTPWIISKCGKNPCYAGRSTPTPKLIMSGSILAEADGSATVWGAGLGHSSEKVNPSAKLLAVRGPLSRLRAMEDGAGCPDVYGDPGLLVPRFYNCTIVDDKKVGILPHFIDQDRVFPAYAVEAERERAALINILLPVEEVVFAMRHCDVIVSSALHGLILAVAFQIPFVWVRFSDDVQGYPFKFWDFFQSLTTEMPGAVDLRGSELPTVDELRKLAVSPPSYNIEPFWELCPFR